MAKKAELCGLMEKRKGHFLPSLKVYFPIGKPSGFQYHPQFHNIGKLACPFLLAMTSCHLASQRYPLYSESYFT